MKKHKTAEILSLDRRGAAELHGPADALDDARVDAGRYRRTGGGRQFRPADVHLPLDLRPGEPRCRGRRRPDQPQVAHCRIARRLVGRDAADGLFDFVRADLLAAGPDGHQRGALHPGQPFADRRLPHGQGPEFRHRRTHDRALCRTGRGRIRGYGRLDVLLAGDLPLVRHHRHRLCRRAGLLPA